MKTRKTKKKKKINENEAYTLKRSIAIERLPKQPFCFCKTWFYMRLRKFTIFGKCTPVKNFISFFFLSFVEFIY